MALLPDYIARTLTSRRGQREASRKQANAHLPPVEGERARLLVALLGGVAFAAGCTGPTDVAVLIRLDAGATTVVVERNPSEPPALGSPPSPSGSMDAGADPFVNAPAPTTPETWPDDFADPNRRGPSAGGMPGDVPQFRQDARGDDRGALWVSGWPMPDWTEATQPWPLERGLLEFFDSPSPDLQIAVWVNGQEADAIEAWWLGLPTEGPEVVPFEGQRFVITQDDAGAIFAVTADRPPDGTSSFLPIPEGFDRD